MSRHRVPS
ncbi:putative U6 snRNA-associated sm family protein Lsm2, partial [Toxoplasma gondii VAND]